MAVTAAPLGPPASRVRYQVLAVACCLALLTYINRLAFGVAASEIKSDLHFTDEQMGYLASAFLVAYGLCQVPGGVLGDRFGARNLLTTLVLVWSLLSGATALGLAFPAGTGMAFVFLIVVRCVFGIFQSAEFPSLARVIADWMPAQERGSAQGAIWTCSRIGGAIVPFLFTTMLWYFHTWTTPFWVMAALGMLWAVAFWSWFRNRPEDMPGVNAGELAILQAGRSARSAAAGHASWLSIWRSPDVWALCAMYSLVGFAGNFFTNMMPLYLKDHCHLTGLSFSVCSALPLAAGIVSCVLGGTLSDRIIRRWGSRKWGRRLIGAGGLAVAGLATLLIPWAGNVYLLAFVLSAAFFCNDLNMGPAWAACADVGERNTGTISGAMNMTGAFAGAAGTAFAGYFFKRDADTFVFVIYACSYGLAALCWLVVNVDRRLRSDRNNEAPTEVEPSEREPLTRELAGTSMEETKT
jgi:sugar phosphate permease